jgi:tetratricopeptide (TPR) repeat protein
MIKGAEHIEQGAAAEAEGNTERAVELYESSIKKGVADPFPFDRLLVIYRKQRKYEDELRVILRGIEVFNEQLEEQQKHLLKRTKNATALKRLSKAFGKTSGLADKKGNSKYLPDPLSKWLKRKKVVEEKIDRSK